MRMCFKCEKEIKVDERVFMLALDKPYVNLWFHAKCYIEIEDTTEEYLLSNYEKLNDFIRERDKKR
jgi:hypothetical protein